MVTKQKPSKKILISIIITVLLATAIGSVIYFKKSSSTKPSSTTSAPQTEKINLEPATSEEKQQSTDTKNQIVENDNKIKESPKPSPSGLSSISPKITGSGVYDNIVEISSFVPGIFEDGGTCTLTARLNSTTINRNLGSVKEGSSVYCPLFKLPVSDFQEKGKWSFTVDYKSKNYEGVSDAVTVDIY